MQEAIEDGTILQYTGLKDKKGKEIYEGDILAHAKDKVVVKYIPPMFEFIDGHGGSMVCNEQFIYLFVVIGNIYENKELLE